MSIWIFFRLIGALALLMFGMKTMSDSLQKMAGPQLRHVLGTMTTNRLTGILAGTLITALGAVHATAFDIGAGCSGFLFALATADAYFASGRFQKALIIGAETLSKMMDWSDRSTCVLFGDGAGAAVVSAEGTQLLSMVQGSDGAGGMALKCDKKHEEPLPEQAYSPPGTGMQLR